MNMELQSQLKASSPPYRAPALTSLVQRKCACGGTPGADGECEECKRKKRLQTKLAIGASNDPLEQEADRVAEQVLAAPARHPLRNAPPRIQRFTGQATQQVDTAHDSADRVLASPGRPLDTTLRQDMESRFGHDFSRVRVHTDAAAEQAAREVNARAYTIGHHVVFNSGRFAPGTQEGRLLIAHELAHVAQQSMSHSVPTIVQRSPDKKADFDIGVPENLLVWSTAVWPKRLSYEQEILMLAANPDHADNRWKGLTPQARIGIAVNMARFYGASFAKQFVEVHEAGKVATTIFEQVGADTTPAQLTARGYHLAGTQAQMDVEIWFHPSGKRLHRTLPHKPPAEPPAAGEEPAELEESPEGEEDEASGVSIELADLTDGQRKAFALLTQMEHMNREFKRMLNEQPPRTSEFMDKEGQFRDLRKQLHELFLSDASLSESEFSSLLIDRMRAVEEFVQLRNSAYGTEIGDWEQIEHRTY
jgi:hypothetical protein